MADQGLEEPGSDMKLQPPADPSVPVRASPGPRPRAHGHIADGGDRKNGLGRRTRSSAASA